MSILEVKNMSFEYQKESLYKDAEMRLFAHDHAVLVGPNGVGKSTLLKLLDKALRPDEGQVEWVPNIKVGYLDQYASIDPTLLVKEYLYDVYLDLFDKEAKMEQLYIDLVDKPSYEQERMLHWASDIQEELIKKDFYAIKSSIGNVINGLGLEMEILESPINHLSGGMRAKIILGKLLLGNSDCILLDEPTNFLDIRHIDWLVKFLNGYEKSFIVVSHNEEFIERIANVVFAVENKKITRYKGDYQFYLKERKLRYEQQEKAYQSQQRFIKETENFIQKNLARASTTKRAQSRRKMLQKVDIIDKPQKEKEIRFHFPFATETGRDVLKVKELVIGYEFPLLSPITTKIIKNDSVVITGKNGIGKSTFIKTITGNIQSIDGEYKWIDTAKMGYFEQENTLSDHLTPFEIVSSHFEELDKKGVIELLTTSGLTYDMITRKTKTLSGGEKTKVRLALMRKEKTNVLIFDEPTNHLDVKSKAALKEALINYPGTIIIVSHEKEFYEDICDIEIKFA
ncbi:ATP-binding cassette domain-containing protein [Acholeplasma sp. OttesenSCG-928-E16]|nr:ATP-binding cassette domain-containing protein [Acholeplasma sp. OttesenSCG-928-E16]